MGSPRVQPLVPALAGLALIAEILAARWLAPTHNLVWEACVVGCTALAVAVNVRWPFGALFAMIAATAMPRYSITIGGWHARPEHIVGGFVLVAWASHVLASKKNVRLNILDTLIFLYILANYLSSATTSPDPSKTLRWALLASLGMLPYFFIRLFGTGRRYLKNVFEILLAVGALEAAYGVICFVANGLFGTGFGVNRGFYLHGRIAAAYGSQFEPNTFGVYAGAASVMFLALYMFDSSRRRPWYGAALLVTAAGVAASLAREAVVACAVAAVFLFYWANRRRRSVGRLLTSTLVAGTLVALLVGTALESRFKPLITNPAGDPTTYVRLIQDKAALRDVELHPLLGNGTDSFQLLFHWSDYVPTWASVKGYIGNTPIMVLHDTGMLGFGLFFVFALLLARRTFRLMSVASKEDLPLLAALAAGMLVYAATAMVADVTILGFFWVQVGLLTSVVCSLDAERKRIVQAPKAGPRNGVASQ